MAKKKAKPSLKEGLKEDARLIRKGAVAGLVTVANLIPTGRAAKTVAKVAGKAAVKSVAKANARGLKAANKPTNKTGTKADRSDRTTLQGNSNLIKNASPARANRTRGGSLAAIKTYGGQGVATAKLTPKQAAYQASISKQLNPVRKAKPTTKK
jgi:hypothetical protein